jgi:hypothetical protein
MQADRRVVAPGDAFHVTIHVHVREKRDRLDELVLPALSNAIDLGDERRRVAAADGTDFYETLTVAASVTGSAQFTPAYIDAIDPATGRGMRYSSQPLTVRVTDGASLADSAGGALAGLLRTVLRLLVAVAFAVAGAIAYVLWRRLRPRRPRIPRPAPAAPAASAPAGDPLRAAFAEYRAQGSGAALDALRAELFVRAGARPGATFADAMTALGSRDPALLRVMAVAERARFGPERERAAARADMLVLVEKYVRDSGGAV